jgi:hypothetical protein
MRIMAVVFTAMLIASVVQSAFAAGNPDRTYYRGAGSCGGKAYAVTAPRARSIRKLAPPPNRRLPADTAVRHRPELQLVRGSRRLPRWAFLSVSGAAQTASETCGSCPPEDLSSARSCRWFAKAGDS